MKNVRFGMIGVGNMGSSYARWLTGDRVPGASLGAVCDIDPARKAWCRDNLPDSVHFFDHYIDLMDSGLCDAVLVVVPHYLHPEIAINGLRRNLHVLVDKPAGIYARQIRAMNEEAARHDDLVFGMMFNQRMNPLYRRVKSIIDNGTIGPIRRVSWMITSWWRTQKYYDSSDWRATWWGEGGGVLVNQAPHQLDLLQWLCGMPVRIQAHLKYGSQRDITVEDDVTAYLEFDNGATGTFITCTHDALGTDLLEIHGDSGKIIIENSAKVTVRKLFKPEQELNKQLDFAQSMALVNGKSGERYFDEESFEEPENWEKQHIDVLINFTDAVLNGTELVAPGSDGIDAVQIANAMFLSDWLDESVALPVDEELFIKYLKQRIADEPGARPVSIEIK